MAPNSFLHKGQASLELVLRRVERARVLAGEPGAGDGELAAVGADDRAHHEETDPGGVELLHPLEIDDDSPDEALHRLRIDAKKLRYLLEFFRALYPPKEIGAVVGALKSLQDNLGDFNDLSVQQGAMRGFAVVRG